VDLITITPKVDKFSSAQNVLSDKVSIKMVEIINSLSDYQTMPLTVYVNSQKQSTNKILSN